MVIFKEGEANRIIINNWSEANNLGINLTGSAPAAPFTTIMINYKILNKQAYKAHGYWVVGHALFNLKPHKTVANDYEWRMTA